MIIPCGGVHWVVTIYSGWVEFCGTPSRYGGSTFTTPETLMPEGLEAYISRFEDEATALGHTWEVRRGQVAA